MSRYYSLPSRIWGDALMNHRKPSTLHFFRITSRIAIMWERKKPHEKTTLERNWEAVKEEQQHRIS